MTDVARKLGYAGSAVIDSIQVLVNSASFQESDSKPYFNMFNTPMDNSSRSRVLQSDGTKISSGSIAFDLTSSSMPLLSAEGLFRRGYVFDVGYHDGEKGWELGSCYMNSLSVSGSAGGLISASLSVTSALGVVSNDSLDRDFIRDQEPYGYWYSGKADVRDWSLSINQNVNPVYTNKNNVWPKYIRVGLWSISLNVTTYDQLHEYEDVSIAGSTFTLAGHTSESGYSFGGLTDLGNYTHTFETAATIGYGSGGSDGTIITIT